MALGDWFRKREPYRKLSGGLEVKPDGSYKYDRKDKKKKCGKETVAVTKQKGDKK